MSTSEESTIPSQAAAVKAQSFGAKKNRLGDSRKADASDPLRHGQQSVFAQQRLELEQRIEKRDEVDERKAALKYGSRQPVTVTVPCECHVSDRAFPDEPVMRNQGRLHWSRRVCG